MLERAVNRTFLILSILLFHICLYLADRLFNLGLGMLKLAPLKSIAVISLFMIILAVPLVMAGAATESFNVFTDKKEYLVGEAVNVYVKADAIDLNQTIMVTDVVVHNSSGIAVAEWHNLSLVLADTTTPAYVGTIIADSEGTYTVSAKASAFWDANGDGKTDLKDVYVILKAYGSTPGDPRWNPLADVNHDNRVDIKDIFLLWRGQTLSATSEFKCGFLYPNSMPEVPVGTIAILISLLMATGLYTIRKNRVEKREKNI